MKTVRILSLVTLLSGAGLWAFAKGGPEGQDPRPASDRIPGSPERDERDIRNVLRRSLQWFPAEDPDGDLLVSPEFQKGYGRAVRN